MGHLIPPEDSDRRHYYCVWSRGTTYFIGVGSGMGMSAMVLILVDLPLTIRYMIVAGAIAMFFGFAIWFDTLKRGEPVTEKKIDELMP